MTQLQPDIMIVNGLDQNGGHAAAVAGQSVGEDLVTDNGGFLRLCAKNSAGGFKTFGKGFCAFINKRNTNLFCKRFDPFFAVVGKYDGFYSVFSYFSK